MLVLPPVTVRGQVFRGSICGNVVKVLEAGGGALVCCGEEMVLVEEKLGNGVSEGR